MLRLKITLEAVCSFPLPSIIMTYNFSAASHYDKTSIINENQEAAEDTPPELVRSKRVKKSKDDGVTTVNSVKRPHRSKGVSIHSEEGMPSSC